MSKRIMRLLTLLAASVVVATTSACELPIACNVDDGDRACPDDKYCAASGFCETIGGDGDGDGDGDGGGGTNGSPCAGGGACNVITKHDDVATPVELVSAGNTLLVADNGDGFGPTSNLWGYDAGSGSRRAILAGRDDVNNVTLNDARTAVYALDRDSAELLRAPLSGGGDVETVMSGLDSFRNNESVGFDQGYAFVSSGSTVYRVGEQGATTSWEAPGDVYNLTVASGNVYYLRERTLRSIPVEFDAGTAEQNVLGLSQGLEDVLFAVPFEGTETFLYFATKAKEDDNQFGQIWRTSPDSTQRRVVPQVDIDADYDDEVEATALAVSSTYLYYATGTGVVPGVFQVRLPESTPERLMDTDGDIRAMALHRGELLIASPGRIRAIPLNP